MSSEARVSIEDYYKMLGDATSFSQVSLNMKWYETDQLTRMSANRHPAGQESPRTPPHRLRTAT